MKRKPISTLEQQVMNIVWSLNKCTIKEVYTEVIKQKNIAYTTVATILIRLYKKGLVKRKMQGTQYIYSPKLSKNTYSKTIIQSFVKTAVDSFGDLALIAFAESIEKLSAKKRNYLLTILETNDKNKQ